MRCNVITIFPDLISHYCRESILGRAQENSIIKVNAVDLRDFTEDRHQKIDDTPYGGGPGMVMKPEPIYKALAALGALTIDYRRQTGLDKLKVLFKSIVGGQKLKKTLLL